jgi:hypothetical protein
MNTYYSDIFDSNGPIDWKVTGRNRRFERMAFTYDHRQRMDSPPCYCSWSNKGCLLFDAEYYQEEFVYEDGPWAAQAARVVKAIRREVARGNMTVEFDKALWNQMVDENKHDTDLRKE